MWRMEPPIHKTCSKCDILKNNMAKDQIRDWGFHSPVINNAGYKWGKTNYYLMSVCTNFRIGIGI